MWKVRMHPVQVGVSRAPKLEAWSAASMNE